MSSCFGLSTKIEVRDIVVVPKKEKEDFEKVSDRLQRLYNSLKSYENEKTVYITYRRLL